MTRKARTLRRDLARRRLTEPASTTEVSHLHPPRSTPPGRGTPPTQMGPWSGPDDPAPRVPSRGGRHPTPPETGTLEPLSGGDVRSEVGLARLGEPSGEVEDQVPGPIAERLDLAQFERRRFDPQLLAHDAGGGIRRVLQMSQVVVGQEPARLTVVLRRVLVLDQHDAVAGVQRHIGDQLVDSALHRHLRVGPSPVNREPDPPHPGGFPSHATYTHRSTCGGPQDPCGRHPWGTGSGETRSLRWLR